MIRDPMSVETTVPPTTMSVKLAVMRARSESAWRTQRIL